MHGIPSMTILKLLNLLNARLIECLALFVLLCHALCKNTCHVQHISDILVSLGT